MDSASERINLGQDQAKKSAKDQTLFFIAGRQEADEGRRPSVREGLRP